MAELARTQAAEDLNILLDDGKKSKKSKNNFKDIDKIISNLVKRRVSKKNKKKKKKLHPAKIRYAKQKKRLNKSFDVCVQKCTDKRMKKLNAFTTEVGDWLFGGVIPADVQKARARAQVRKETKALLNTKNSLVRPRVKQPRKKRLITPGDKALKSRRAEATKRMLTDKRMGRILYTNEPGYQAIPKRSTRNQKG